MNKSNIQKISILAMALFPFQLFASYGHRGAFSPWILWAILGGVVWWLVASGLLFFTWNKVIVALFNAKTAKFWQVLLLVATLFAFCAPHLMSKKRGGSYHSFHGKKCGMLHGKRHGNHDGKEICPFAKEKITE